MGAAFTLFDESCEQGRLHPAGDATKEAIVASEAELIGEFRPIKVGGWPFAGRFDNRY